MLENETENLVEKKKKGRKPTTNNYFDEREEIAVRKFLLAETQEEKNKISNTIQNSQKTNSEAISQKSLKIIEQSLSNH